VRALSERQARQCESAKGGRCRCRCQGAFHGKARIAEDEPRSAFELLSDDDPHRIPPKKMKKKGATRWPR
jgi:hypothetical protein